MFERFTSGAREVVVQAQRQARDLGHATIGTEHLLLALLQGDQDDAAARILADSGVSPEATRSLLQGLWRCHQALDPADAGLLDAIGIDLQRVRHQVEATFGQGALDRGASAEGRRRRRWHRLVDHIPFSPRAKKVLELSLRESLALRQRHIGPEHILLGLLREGQGLAARVLVNQGLDLVDLRRRLLLLVARAS
jgi:ATP-dependent Clp protease ATP-binding subunit ClpA